MPNDPEHDSRSPMSSLGCWGTVIVTGIVIITCILEAIYGQEGALYNFFMFIFNVIGTLLAFFQLFRPKFKLSSRPRFSSSSLANFLTKSVRPAWYVVMSLLMVISLTKFFVFPSKPNPPRSNPSSYTPCSTVKTANINSSERLNEIIQVGNNKNSECIGISDGGFPFDTSMLGGDQRPDNYATVKWQALEKLNAGDFDGAYSLWKKADVTNDAEMLIYFENQQVLMNHNNPYINIVVGTMLTGEYVRTGRDIIQGVYVAQKENNENRAGHCIFSDPASHQCTQIRILIANSGGSDSTERTAYTGTVAKMIADNKEGKNIKGIIGWPFSGQSTNAEAVLAPQQIPILSPIASSTSLSGAPYFWRVAPSDKASVEAAVQYVQKKLGSQKVAVFYDSTDPYSRSLGEGFINIFEANTHITAYKEPYIIGHTSKEQMESLIIDAQQRAQGLDLIFFAGYSGDAIYLFQALPPAAQFPNLKVMGGDAVYDIGSYTQGASQFPKEAYGRLFFTAFGYSDTWTYLKSSLKLPQQQHPFFCEYTIAFDPQTPCGSLEDNLKYYYNRPDGNAILAYDAAITLVHGCSEAMQIALIRGDSNFSFQDLNQALGELNGNKAIQGASGQITLGPETVSGPDGDPKNKAVVIIGVNTDGSTSLDDVYGCFTKEEKGCQYQ